MISLPTLTDVKHHVRAQVCADCRDRMPGTDANPPDQPRACETKCPLFVQLNVLTEAARQADPLLGNPTRTLHRMVSHIGDTGRRRAATILRNGRKVIKILEQMFQT